MTKIYHSMTEISSLVDQKCNMYVMQIGVGGGGVWYTKYFENVDPLLSKKKILVILFLASKFHDFSMTSNTQYKKNSMTIPDFKILISNPMTFPVSMTCTNP